MIATDIENLYFQGTAVQIPEGSHPFGHFYCPKHEGCRIEVLCTKQDFQPSLMCIKCIIDPQIQRHVKSDEMLPIHDIINKAASPSQLNIRTETTKATLERKFSEFSAKDYVGTYDQHVRLQVNKLDREIESIRESLEELRFQFIKIFEKQSIDLKKREEELKIKFRDFIGEQELIERLNGATLVDIVDAIQHITNLEEFEKYLKVINLRNSYSNPMVESLHLQELFSAVSNFRARVNAMRRCKLDTSKLEDIRKRIDSIEMLDKSLQSLPQSLDLKLNQTFEKILHKKPNKPSVSHESKTPVIETQKFDLELDGDLQGDLVTYTVDVGTQTPKVKDKHAKTSRSERRYSEPVEDEELNGQEAYPFEDRDKERMDLTDYDFKDAGCYDPHEEDTAYHRTEGNSPGSLTQEKTGVVPQGLYDWINRRVTGYLIFHNTVHKDESVIEEKENENAHLNHIAGEKWHHLSKLEREEYINLAMKTRVKLKKKFENVELENPKAAELQEVIDKKVKKVKLH